MHVLDHYCAENDSQTDHTVDGDSQTGPTTEIGAESVIKAAAVAGYSDEVFSILKNKLAG